MDRLLSLQERSKGRNLGLRALGRRVRRVLMMARVLLSIAYLRHEKQPAESSRSHAVGPVLSRVGRCHPATRTKRTAVFVRRHVWPWERRYVLGMHTAC